MSYILDAIEEADKTRRQDESPRVAPIRLQYAENDPKESYLRKYWWVAVLLVNAILLLFISTQLSSPKNIVFAEAPAEAPVVLTKPITSSPVVAVEKQAIEKPVNTEKTKVLEVKELNTNKNIPVSANDIQHDIQPKNNAIKPVVIATVTSRNNTIDKDLSPSTSTQVKEASSPAINNKIIAKVAPLPQFDVPASRLLPHAEIVEEDVKVAYVPETNNKKDVPQQIVITPDDVRSLSSLSKEERAAIPDINMSVHLFNENPTLRKARINGRMYFENQFIENNLKLVRITPNGAIFQAEELKFSINLR